MSVKIYKSWVYINAVPEMNSVGADMLIFCGHPLTILAYAIAVPEQYNLVQATVLVQVHRCLFGFGC